VLGLCLGAQLAALALGGMCRGGLTDTASAGIRRHKSATMSSALHSTQMRDCSIGTETNFTPRWQCLNFLRTGMAFGSGQYAQYKRIPRSPQRS
jgi:hypothetical protein